MGEKKRKWKEEEEEEEEEEERRKGEWVKYKKGVKEKGKTEIIDNEIR